MDGVVAELSDEDSGDSEGYEDEFPEPLFELYDASETPADHYVPFEFYVLVEDERD